MNNNSMHSAMDAIEKAVREERNKKMTFKTWQESTWPDVSQEERRKMSSAWTAAIIDQAHQITHLEERLERYKDEIRDTKAALVEIHNILKK